MNVTDNIFLEKIGVKDWNELLEKIIGRWVIDPLMAMLIWNWIVVSIFELPKLAFWQMFFIMLLVRFLK